MGPIQRQQQLLAYRNSGEFKLRSHGWRLQDHDQVPSDHWMDFADCPGVAEVELGELVEMIIDDSLCPFVSIQATGVGNARRGPISVLCFVYLYLHGNHKYRL